MGRKRHPIISEYFNRHDKLPDGSNRYEHSCKACNERFPKGRIETLQTHLAKYCQVILPEDRQRALAHFSSENGTGEGASLQGDLPFTPKQSTGMSALDALAEVSSHHLGSNSASVPGEGSVTSPGARDISATRPLTAEDLLVADVRGPEDNVEEKPGTNAESLNGLGLNSPHTFGGARISPYHSPHLHGLPLPTSSASMVATSNSPLVMTAAAANDLQASMPSSSPEFPPDADFSLSHLSNNNLPEKSRTRDERSTAQVPNPDAIDPMLQDLGKQSPAKSSHTGKASPFLRAIAMNPQGAQSPFAAGLNAEHKVSKAKVRGRFADNRRKEVQEVRKRGSCIRCRMLKKSCSAETPCKTCVNVESARLWKQPCLRTRLVEEFKLYNYGLRQRGTNTLVQQAKERIAFSPAPGRIEMTFAAQSDTLATFAMVKGTQVASASIDPSLLANGDRQEINQTSEVYILDAETDDISLKIEQYIKSTASEFCDAEQSPFIKSTLTKALSMKEGEKDGLLARTVELWNVTSLLTSPRPAFHLLVNTHVAPSLSPVALDSVTSKDPRGVPFKPSDNNISYDMITQQLLGAIEKRGGQLSKFVMNELERRLLERAKTNHFESFLVSIILLACTERMCGYFKSWDHSAPLNPAQSLLAQQSRQALGMLGEGPEEHAESAQNSDMRFGQFLMEFIKDSTNMKQSKADKPGTHGGISDGPAKAGHDPSNEGGEMEIDAQPGATHTSNSNGDPARTNNRDQDTNGQSQARSTSEWTHEVRPSDLAQQGERFSEMIHMLLKLRGILPKTDVRASDGIVVSTKGGKPVGSNKDQPQQQQPDDPMKDWFEAVRLDPRDLAAGKRLVEGGHGDYVVKLLVPQD